MPISPAFTIKRFLPRGDHLEEEIIESAISLNAKIKETLTPDDTVLLTKLRMGSSETQAQDQWVRALQLIQDQFENEILSLDLISNLNFLLTARAGFRKVQVAAVGVTEFPPPGQVPFLMDELHRGVQNVSHPISRAAFIYQALSAIHPFEDGNGRTARLVADHTLILNGFVPLIFPAPTLALVVPAPEGTHPHLLALRRVLDSTQWAAKLFARI